MFGFIPNFYVSYVPDAAPLSPRHKFSLAWKSATDPVTFAAVGMVAGFDQAGDRWGAYGQGARGYAKRFGASYGDVFAGTFIGSAILPTVLQQDPRYYYQGSGSFRSRLMHAVGSVFAARSDAGRTVPNSSYLLGDMGAAALSSLYYPKANRGANLVFTNAAVGLAGRVGMNLFREFLSKRLTTNVPGDRRF